MIAEMIDKVGSVARRVEIDRTMTVGDDFAKLGDLVVFEIVTTGNIINELELTSGRITTPTAGDVVLGAVGSRRAVAKLIATVPTKGLEINRGTELALLSRGGLIGKIDEQIQDGSLTNVRCLGVVKRKGIVANIRDFSVPFSTNWSRLPPLVIVVGTNMEVGKTSVACGLTKAMKKSGLRICGAKLTGIASWRDILRLKDAGAIQVADFVDGGLATTLDGKDVREASGTVLNYLASFDPDVIVAELGGGILLGAPILLGYQELRKNFSAVILAAPDITAAFGGVEALKRFHDLTIDAIGGPVANSVLFRNAVKQFTGVEAYDFRDLAQSSSFLQTISVRLRSP